MEEKEREKLINIPTIQIYFFCPQIISQIVNPNIVLLPESQSDDLGE